MFYVNKSQYKASYAAGIIDGFIGTDRLETYQQLNESKNLIDANKKSKLDKSNKIRLASG